MEETTRLPTMPTSTIGLASWRGSVAGRLAESRRSRRTLGRIEVILVIVPM